MGPLNEWVVDTGVDPTLRRRCHRAREASSTRKLKKSPNKRKYTDAKTNEQKREITGALVLRNNNRNSSSNALDNYLATCQSAVRGLPQSLGRRAAPLHRRCFHSFPSSLLPLRKIAAQGSFESRSSSRDESEANGFGKLFVFGVWSRILTFFTQRLCLLRADCAKVGQHSSRLSHPPPSVRARCHLQLHL